jgi:hypothetical protein
VNLTNVATIVFSLFALIVSAISVVIATRQVSLQDKANNASAVVTILSEFRDPLLHESFEQMFERLPNHDPRGGLSGLPPDLRHHTYNVCYFLNQIACMLVLRILREDAFLAIFRARSIAVWQVAGPFIQREREINPSVGPEFLSVVEALAARSAGIGPEVGRGILMEWLNRPVGTH